LLKKERHAVYQRLWEKKERHDINSKRGVGRKLNSEA
jgi:hypothetical protein